MKKTSPKPKIKLKVAAKQPQGSTSSGKRARIKRAADIGRFGGGSQIGDVMLTLR